MKKVCLFIFSLAIMASCNDRPAEGVTEIHVEDITETNDAPEPPPPPTANKDIEGNLKNWFSQQCAAKGKVSDTAYRLTLFDSEKNLMLGWNALKKSNPGTTYFVLSKTEYEGLASKDRLNRIKSQLKEYSQEAAFRECWLAKESISIHFDDNTVLKMGQSIDDDLNFRRHDPRSRN